MAYTKAGALFGHGPATSAPYSIAPAGVITLRPRGADKSRLATVMRKHQPPPGPAGISRTGPAAYWKGWDVAGKGLSGGLGLNPVMLQPLEILEPGKEVRSKGGLACVGRNCGTCPMKASCPAALGFLGPPSTWGWMEWAMVGVGAFLIYRFFFSDTKRRRRSALRKARQQYKTERAQIMAKYA